MNEHNFDGWLQFPYSHPASPYYGSLVMHFECLSFTPATGSPRTCTSFGVNRLGIVGPGCFPFGGAPGSLLQLDRCCGHPPIQVVLAGK